MSSTNADRVASGPLAAGSVPKEVTWDGLDKRKFFVVGAGMFSCVTCALYPLTVIKTRQMVDGSVPGGGRPPPALSIVRDIVKERGIPGLYRGFGTIVVGTLPIRFVYLSTLEVVKARARTLCEALDLPPMAHGIADAAGGATASMCSQVLGVPVDIISQRQMVQGVAVRAASGEGTVRLQGYRNGVDALRTIVRTEGVRGLLRGNGTDILRNVPYSAIQYFVYEKLKGQLLDMTSGDVSPMLIRFTAGGAAGAVAIAATYPLDLVRSRLCVQHPGAQQYSGAFDAVRKIVATEGVRSLCVTQCAWRACRASS